MNFRNRSRFYSPDSTGGGGAGGGDAGAAGAASGAGAGAGTPQYASASDLSSLRSEISSALGEFGNSLKSFRSDYDRRFAPANGGDNASIDREPDLNDPKYAGEKGVRQFLADTTKFHAQQNFKTFQSQSEKASKENALKARRSSQLQNHITRMAEAQGRYKDFDIAIQTGPGKLPDGANGSPDVLSDVMESEHSADIQYFLSKNHGEYWKLLNAYNQSEKAGYAALKLLEHRFASEKAERVKARKAAGVHTSEDVSGELGGGVGDEDEKYSEIANAAFGLNRKKK